MEIIFANDMIGECVKIRTEVFVIEQGVPPELEVDGFDAEDAPCDHYLIMDGGDAVGTFRCIFEGDAVHAGRRHGTHASPRQHGGRPVLVRHDRHDGTYALRRAVRGFVLRPRSC